VSIAEVVVCWALVGASFEALTKPKGKLVAMPVGIITATLLFAVYHVAHSAPFNQLNMVLFLLIPGLLTSLVISWAAISTPRFCFITFWE
jgi:hypothetical protein